VKPGPELIDRQLLSLAKDSSQGSGTDCPGHRWGHLEGLTVIGYVQPLSLGSLPQRMTLTFHLLWSGSISMSQAF
jgi:hypothetical protein